MSSSTCNVLQRFGRTACLRLLLALGVVAPTAAFAVEPDAGIELRRRVAVPGPVARSAAAPTRRLQLLQLAYPPTDADLDAIRAAGVRIVDYVPRNAYLVWVDDPQRAARLVPGSFPRLAQRTMFSPADALAPALDDRVDDVTPVDVTVQLAATASTVTDDLQHVQALADLVLQAPYEAVHGKYVHVRIRTVGKALTELTALDSVVNVEPFVRPRLLGERQGQILANQLTPGGDGPAGPGYLDFLAQAGFSTDRFDYPVVAVVDDGVDNGTTLPVAADLYVFGSTAQPSRMTFSVLPPGSAAPDPAGPDGHGTINASIIGGFNDGVGAGVEDVFGFQYGLGISPYGRMGNVRIFAPDFDIGDGNPTMVADYYARGARISANSWGADVEGVYDSMSQEYDALTRDARAAVGGNQEILFVFAAGNAGPGPGSVGSPGSAKNVITVGAGETSDPDGSIGSGCGDDGNDADDVDDMSGFSSRGPCRDGRMKPDLVAPGTFIHGLAPQPEFNGSGVCGPAGNDFTAPGDDALFPPGSAYTWSSGTSHSTPAIAGAASLAHEFLARVYGRTQPSPALVKALLVQGARHMTGSLANETLPGRHQGFGRADLSLSFDRDAARILHDQETLLGQSGTAFDAVGEVADIARPLRIVLAWTDAPGPTFGSAYVNDLDLVVEIDGVVYRGNRFAGGTSQPGGVADPRNNVEAVFLPAGTSGLVRIRIEASSIGGDGVPGNGDPTDQDFALVAYNVSDVSPRGFVYFDRSTYTCTSEPAIGVADSDLTSSGTVDVAIDSDTGDAEDLALDESPVDSGAFVGTIGVSTAEPSSDGILQVDDGARITATYLDADDGTGAPATATAEAVFDCVGPTPADIDVTAIDGATARVTLSTDEAATVRVRIGPSCAALDRDVQGAALATVHEVAIDELDPETTYFFLVEATDAAGNVTVEDNGGACFMVTTPERTEYFVEAFTGDFDLANTTLTYVPDGSVHYYGVCRTSAAAFPTDPAGGVDLALGDDDFAEVALADGQQVSIFGQTAESVYVGSNGYVTFTGDSDFSESLAEHFAIPRVSGLFDDLNPSAGGTISVKQLDDRLAVTYAGVPEYFDTGANDLQIELFFDGRIAITFLDVSALDGIVGLAAGDGLPGDFVETDLSGQSACALSAGSVSIDGTLFDCGDSVRLEVTDGDLVGFGTATVAVSTRHGDAEAIALTESPPNSGSFSATVVTQAGDGLPGDGLVQVGPGDELTATYDDGDDGDGQPRQVSAHVPIVCGDPFVLYQTSRGTGATRFRSFAPVELTDAVRSAAFKVLRTDKLGAPATVAGGVPLDGTTHLHEFKVREDRGEERLSRVRDVRVRNRCGALFVDFQRVLSVLLPAGLSTDGPVAAPAEEDHTLDSYLCYKAKALKRLSSGQRVDGFPKGIQIEVVDTLNQGATRRYDLKKPTRVCRPVAIDGDPSWTAGPNRGEPAPIVPATVRYGAQEIVCYSATLARKYIAQDGCGPADPDDRGERIDPRQDRHPRTDGLHVADGFATAIVKSTKEKEICLPSIVE